MLSEGRTYMQSAPWLMIYPGIAIFIVVSVFNLFGDAVRDLFDPKADVTKNL
jgi:ABC-type dipeptide/oligopeptide/nickel transport system permease subunit